MNAKILILFAFILFVAGFGAPVLAQTASTAAATQGFVASKDKSYNLGLNYSAGKLSPKEIVLENLPPLDHRVWPNDGWTCQMVAVDGTVIDSFKFSLPVVECRDQSDAAGGLAGGCVAGTAADFDLSVPYYANGAVVAVFDPAGNLAFSVDTIKFADLCGDNVCEQNENYLTCAKDCRSGVKDGACDKVADGTCDADCAAKDDPDCAAAGFKADYIYLIILAAISVLGAAGFVLWRKRSRKEI